MKHALLAVLLLSGSASAQTFGTIPDELQARLAARRPVLNGVDVSAALGTFRMDSPQHGCPMTVYGRFEDGGLDVWSDSTFHLPALRFMNEGQSLVFGKSGEFGGYEYYLRASVSRAASNAGVLDLYQELVAGQRKWNKVEEYGAKLPSPHQLSLDANGRMTLVRREYLWSKPHLCSYQKISAAPGPLAPRSFQYAFEARVLVGDAAGLLRASFDLDEFTDFHRNAALRGYAWTITLDDGRTLGEEAPLPDGNWRKGRPGLMIPGTRYPNTSRPFFAELEAGAFTKLEGRDHLLRLFLACDEALSSCEVGRSDSTGSATGFYAEPFSSFERSAPVPVTLEGDARIQLKRR